MDDFLPSSLHESKNEWCARLVTILTPLVLEGIHSILNEAWNMCVQNDQSNKYLMTFQSLLCRVPKWNSVIVEEERQRIVTKSGCNYLEDLITCVHIIQLKVLTAIRVSNKQKKIDIHIPKLDHFLHKVYIHAARKVYSNVYLFEKGVTPLIAQRHQREAEVLVQESILHTVRESIPTEAIIRAYLDESLEQEEEVIIEAMPEEPKDKDKEQEQEKEQGLTTESVPLSSSSSSLAEEEAPAFVENTITDLEPDTMTKLTFQDTDRVLHMDTNVEEEVSAPKTEERLERIATERAIQRGLEQDEDEDEDDRKGSLQILDDSQPLTLSDIGFEDASASVKADEPFVLDFETVL
jgi:hypothetical protein